MPTFTLHISPAGHDHNPGTESAPLLTLTAARDRVRNLLRAAQPPESVTVKLAAGTYPLSETLVLGPEDGGNKQHPVTWEGDPNGATVLSAGIPLPEWTRCTEDLPGLPQALRGRVWRTQLPPGTDINTLYSPSGSLPRARGPALQPRRLPWSELPPEGRQGPYAPITEPIWADTATGFCPQDRFGFDEGAIPRAPDLHTAEAVIIPAMQWTMNILPIRSVDFEQRTVNLARPCTYPIGIPHCAPDGSIWIENSLAILSPGHWVHHPDTGTLYYCPESGEPESGLLAGRLVETLRIEGSPDTPARHIRLRHLTFTHTSRYRFHGLTGLGIQHDWEMHDAPTCMVRLRHTHACSVEHCRFTEGGSGGIRLDLACRENHVEHCEFDRLGGCGIVLCGYGLSRKYLNRNNHILHNHLHHLGRAYWHCPGIFIWQSGENHVADNDIHDLPYTGIVCSGRTIFDRTGKGECSRTIHWDDVEDQCGKDYTNTIWYYAGLPSWSMREPLMHSRDNLIEYNRIRDVMQIMGDGNGIYVSGGGGGNTVRFNIVGPCPSPTFAEGIRCDDDQHHTIIHGNLIHQLGGRATGITLKGVNRVTNNIIALALTPTFRGFLSLETGPLNGSVIQRNLFLAADPSQRFVNDLRIHGQGRKARLQDTESDHNLYWCLSDPHTGTAFLAHARSFGTDTHSLAADPGFLDPANGDYRLHPDAPARALGFQDLPLDRMLGSTHTP